MGRMSSIHPVNRIKHVVDAEGGLVAGTQSRSDVIDADDSPTLNVAPQVMTGSVVNGIYLHIEVSHTSGTGRPNIYFALIKIPGNGFSPPQANAVGINDLKRYVIHQEMIMMSGDAGNGLPRSIFNGVIAIPKGYKRFGPDDRLAVLLLSPNVAADFCLQCHYKEFR